MIKKILFILLFCCLSSVGLACDLCGGERGSKEEKESIYNERMSFIEERIRRNIKNKKFELAYVEDDKSVYKDNVYDPFEFYKEGVGYIGEIWIVSYRFSYDVVTDCSNNYQDPITGEPSPYANLAACFDTVYDTKTKAFYDEKEAMKMLEEVKGHKDVDSYILRKLEVLEGDFIYRKNTNVIDVENSANVNDIAKDGDNEIG